MSIREYFSESVKRRSVMLTIHLHLFIKAWMFTSTPSVSLLDVVVRHRGNLFFHSYVQVKSRSQWPCGLRRGSRPVGCWDRGFESRSRHGCLSLVFLCCVVLCRSRPCDGLITRPRSPTICLNNSRNLICEEARVLIRTVEPQNNNNNNNNNVQVKRLNYCLMQ
jgi:hypothetical protein